MTSPCFHTFVSDPEHAGYAVCPKCKTHKSLDAPAPVDLYTPDYWTEERGHSTFSDQIFNVNGHIENGVTKAHFILSQIRPPDRHHALEIGCAPGILMRRIREDMLFENVAGIEMVKEWGPDIYRIAGFDAEMHFGEFPQVTKGKPGNRFSLIVACDVFEHSPRPYPFLQECHRLLKKGGQLLMMAPIVTGVYELPERMFDPSEHVWIHSMDNLAAMLGQAGFHSIAFDAWCPGHEVCSAIKGEVPDARLTAA